MEKYENLYFYEKIDERLNLEYFKRREKKN